MPPTAVGTIIMVVLGLVVLYKVLVWVVPVDYEAFKAQVVHETAIQIVSKGIQHEEMYTREGNLRSQWQKRIASKENELYDLHNYESQYIIKYFQQHKLVNKYGKTRKILVGRLVNAFYDYVLYDRKYVYKDMEADIFSMGITPEQFLDLKRTVEGDVVGVYVIYNIDRKMYYVGQAKRLYFRVWQHFTGHGNGDVYADYKYGNRFVIRFVSLNESGYNDLDLLERDMIQHYNAFTTGYNKTVGNGRKQTKVCY